MSQPINGPQQPWGPQGQPMQGQPGPWQGQPMPPGQSYPGTPMMAPPPKKKSPVKIIVAAVIALALIGGGAFAAFTLLGKGNTAAAAKALPGNALGVVSINLNPPGSDQLAVKGIVEKFPEFTEGLDITEGNYKQALWEFVADKSENAPSWDEVKGWLGDSVAFGIYSGDKSDSPKLVAAVQATDTAKAETAIKGWLADEKDLQTRVVDNFVLVSDSEIPSADEIKKGSLADDAEYKADMAKLTGSYLATVWADSKGLAEALQNVSGTTSANIQGRMAAGLKVDGNTVVLEASSYSDVKVAKGEAVDGIVGGLPGDAVGAVGFSTPLESIKAVWDQLKDQPQTEQALTQLGLTSPEDLSTLFGDQTAIYVPERALDVVSGDARSGSTPGAGLVVKTKDADKHTSLFDDIIDRAVPEGVPGLKHEAKGDKVYTGFNIEPSELASPSNKLSDSEAYKQVVKDASGANAIFFVDLGKIFAKLPSQSSALESAQKLTGVGIVGKQVDDHYAQAVVRIGLK